MPTKIEWTNESWNPITGCTPVSEGCRNCYAERMARRLAGRYGYPEAPHHFDVTLHPDRIDAPLKRKKPTMYFVCSMSDLFHKDVPPSYIGTIANIMKRASQHTFQILTKRPRRMFELTNWLTDREGWPDNVWLGTSIENQAAADERIPLLLQTPAAVRFVSVEPMLGPVDLSSWLPGYIYKAHGKWIMNTTTGRDLPPISWCIVGGESGPGARPMHPGWARSLRDQCQAVGTPYFFKQWGAWLPMSQGAPECGTSKIYMFGDLSETRHVGKKHAGRLLDGQVWDQFPVSVPGQS